MVRKSKLGSESTALLQTLSTLVATSAFSPPCPSVTWRSRPRRDPPPTPDTTDRVSTLTRGQEGRATARQREQARRAATDEAERLREHGVPLVAPFRSGREAEHLPGGRRPAAPARHVGGGRGSHLPLVRHRRRLDVGQDVSGGHPGTARTPAWAGSGSGARSGGGPARPGRRAAARAGAARGAT